MDKKEKKLLAAQIEEKFADVFEGVSDYIFRHPELGGDEYESSNYLAELMRSYAFDVSIPYGNEKTAFRAEKKNGSGPVVALLAEYDALPGYGDNGAAAHACGHNWIAAVTALLWQVYLGQNSLSLYFR